MYVCMYECMYACIRTIRICSNPMPPDPVCTCTQLIQGQETTLAINSARYVSSLYKGMPNLDFPVDTLSAAIVPAPTNGLIRTPITWSDSSTWCNGKHTRMHLVSLLDTLERKAKQGLILRQSGDDSSKIDLESTNEQPVQRWHKVAKRATSCNIIAEAPSKWRPSAARTGSCFRT
jgi:hypothetical protein